MTKAFLPLLHRSPAGRIVNVSSRMGSLPAEAAGTVADVALQRSPALAGAFVDRDGSVPW